jgi:hypothetical protein
MPYSYLKGKKFPARKKNKLIKTRGVVTTPSLGSPRVNQFAKCA